MIAVFKSLKCWLQVGWGQAWTQMLGTDTSVLLRERLPRWDAHVSPKFDDNATYVRSVFFHRGFRKFYPHPPAGSTCITGLGEMNWPPVSTLYLLTRCSDSKIKVFRNTLKRIRKITKQWGFYLPCFWTVQHYVCDAQLWAPGRESYSLSLCHLGLLVLVSCLGACNLSNHLLRTVSPSVLLSFAFFLPFRPTVPARGPEPGLFIWLNYIKVPISLTSYWPRYTLSELCIPNHSAQKFKWVTVSLLPDRVFAFFLKTFMVAPFEIWKKK